MYSFHKGLFSSLAVGWKKERKKKKKEPQVLNLHIYSWNRVLCETGPAGNESDTDIFDMPTRRLMGMSENVLNMVTSSRRCVAAYTIRVVYPKLPLKYNSNHHYYCFNQKKWHLSPHFKLLYSGHRGKHDSEAGFNLEVQSQLELSFPPAAAQLIPTNVCFMDYFYTQGKYRRRLYCDHVTKCFVSKCVIQVVMVYFLLRTKNILVG